LLGNLTSLPRSHSWISREKGREQTKAKEEKGSERTEEKIGRKREGGKG